MAIAALLVGSVLKGAGLSALWSPAAFVIVFCGTVAAVLLQTPGTVFKRALKIVRWVFRPPTQDRSALIARLVGWSTVARKQGLLGLEAEVASLEDPFLKKGLQMVVDGVEPESIRQMLEIEMHGQSSRDLAAAKVYEGAVLGLIAVMKNLADPSKLGHGIAAAFTATIYGIGLANLALLPMASKLKGLVNSQTEEREMIVEGLIAIAQGENPRNIEARLNGYVH
jgi:chemotaxis protein MotA